MMVRSVIGLLVLGTSGCAAILSSGPTDLDFNSRPEGAEILVNGEPRGTTPVTLKLHADDDYIVTFRKEGCRDENVHLQTHTQAGYVVLDILLTGLIGVAVDAATGEWREFNDKEPFIEMQCG